jgi:hypothetical protein
MLINIYSYIFKRKVANLKHMLIIQAPFHLIFSNFEGLLNIVQFIPLKEF